ncbi:MAG: hypothetical protein ASARMPRED_002215 [Alectoria sarmentosa]|nr:MAG: hypothetical protein ASARMPRED_002215 [Alectoria sarmentosa]
MLSESLNSLQQRQNPSHERHSALLDNKAVPCANKAMVTVTQIELTNEESPKPVLSLKSTQSRQRQPLPRLNRPAISNPTFNDLFDLASKRVLDVVLKCTKDPPPRLFPNSEHIRHTFFPASVWEQYGDMETESGQISYMLAQYPERGLPLRSSTTIRNLLGTSNPLEKWSEYIEDLADQAHVAQKEALKAMLPHFPETPSPVWSKADFVRIPVGYSTDGLASLDLWSAAVEGMASYLEAGKPHNIEAFLHIHSFIKDPIGGLRAPSPRQIVIFSALWSRTQAVISRQLQAPLPQAAYQQIAAQLALESSFLSIPKLRKTSHIHFSHHQQLCYVYTTIDHLPRAEFSVPARVLEILLEIVLETSKLGTCAMAPITIAYASPTDPNDKPFKVIIDGNNRVSALVLLRFLAIQSGPDMIDPRTLSAHCTAHGLGPKWLIDLRDVLATLLGSDPTLELVRKHWIAIRQFSNVSRIPALLVQEQSFFTLCLGRGTNERPVLLQPMHQTIFNDENLCVAFPAKRGQAHGRSLGYAVLPLKYDGERQVVQEEVV